MSALEQGGREVLQQASKVGQGGEAASLPSSLKEPLELIRQSGTSALQESAVVLMQQSSLGALQKKGTDLIKPLLDNLTSSSTSDLSKSILNAATNAEETFHLPTGSVSNGDLASAVDAVNTVKGIVEANSTEERAAMVGEALKRGKDTLQTVEDAARAAEKVQEVLPKLNNVVESIKDKAGGVLGGTGADIIGNVLKDSELLEKFQDMKSFVEDNVPKDKHQIQAIHSKERILRYQH